MRGPRVLHAITLSAPYAGAQANTLTTCEELAKAGYEVCLTCGPGGPLIDRARASGVETIVCPNLRRELHPMADLRALRELTGIISSRQLDIVHTHSSKAGLLGRLAARRAKVPAVVHTVHGVPYHDRQSRLTRQFYLYVEKWAARWCDALVAVGPGVKREIVEKGVAPADKVSVVYSGIRFDRFDVSVEPAEKRAELGLPTNVPMVGTVGRLDTQKGHRYLLQAVPQVLRKRPTATFVLVGDGELAGQLREQVKHLGVSDHVRFLGERADVPELLPMFDVFVMSSLWEGVGRALTEAMYLERPVVATEVNAVCDLVIHERTGLLVPPAEPAALAQAIVRLLDNPLLARKLGKAARAQVYPRWSAEKMGADTAALYEKLLAAGPRRARSRAPEAQPGDPGNRA